jgi:Sugar-specific transcriptional regulator TrmB.
MRIHRQIINQLLGGMEQISAIVHDKELAPQEKVMMILIMQDCNLKNFSASDITEFPQRTVYDSLSSLVEKGYLKKVKKGYACNVDFICVMR